MSPGNDANLTKVVISTDCLYGSAAYRLVRGVSIGIKSVTYVCTSSHSDDHDDNHDNVIWYATKMSVRI